MGVTIDSLQIEIQSSSTNASEGISALAKSLGELKQNGAFKTVTNNLNRLSDALNKFPNVHKTANALRTLSNSIEQLKNVGSISGIATSLEKLPNALKGLEKIDFDQTAPLIEKVVQTLGKLSGMKSGGLSSIVNGLSKLKEVSEKLDDDTIAEFGKKVAELNEKLAPLSQKMTSIKDGFKAISSGAKKAADSVEEFAEEANATTFNASNLLNVITTVAQGIQELVTRFADLIHQASEWDGIAARFGRGFGPQAQETYAWIQRLNEEMHINVQEFMKYSSVYSTMLTGFGVASEDAGKMALGYMELTYDIWAGYNDVYASLEETAEAVKSAIAGEVEPVRRAGFTIVESTLEQTAANHGLEISLEKATEAQKSYLRYLTMVDQAHAQGLVGTYAKEMHTAEGLMRTFAQQLKSLTQAFGSLFLPVLVKVMPYVQAFVELLTEGVHWLATLLGVEIQKVDFSGYEVGAGAIENIENSANGATGALNDATKAAKELKNATLGIDELNVISPNTASGAGGGSGSGAGGGAGDGFAGLGIDSLWDESIFDTIQSDVDAIKEKLRGWMPVIAGVYAGLVGLRLVGLIKDLELVSKLTGVFKGIGDFFKTAKLMAPEVGWIAALFPKLSGLFASIGTAISGAATAIGAFVAGISAPVWATIVAVIAGIASVVYFLYENWEEVTAAVKRFFAENIAPKLEDIGEHFGKIKETLKPLTDLLAPVVKWFKELAVTLMDFEWGVLGTAFEWLGGLITGVVGGIIAGTINSAVNVIKGFVQTLSGAIQSVAGFFELVWGLITGNGEKIKSGFSSLIAGIADIWGGLYDMTIGSVIEFFKGVISWFTEMWDILVGHSIVPDTVNSIVKWFTSLPSKIFSSIDKFVTGIVDKFKGLWSKLVSWWNGKTKLKEYTPSIGSIYDKLKSRWDSARTWWNDKKSKLKEYTPSIGSIYEKVYDRWKNARDWWNSKKGSFKTYTPSIGSITDKLKSAWNSAKSWWSKNVKLSTKLNISVPTIKVKWDTATAFGKSFKYPTGFSLKFAADGGIFDQGSLIWAGERGPEVMATAAGGKTGVMNVQQMQEAVYEGVYSAVVAAMRGTSGNGSQTVKVYLDGKEITSTVERHQSERGASLMGSEVYAY